MLRLSEVLLRAMLLQAGLNANLMMAGRCCNLVVLAFLLMRHFLNTLPLALFEVRDHFILHELLG